MPIHPITLLSKVWFQFGAEVGALSAPYACFYLHYMTSFMLHVCMLTTAHTIQSVQWVCPHYKILD